MYEKFYGLSAPPFQVNPDPSFYFESKGHSAAYQYLRFGAFQGEGFVVVTGEIGSGKTTLLRALLAELDPERIVAAQLVSTQLGADELLTAVAQAFGINTEGLGKSRLLVTLEAFLARLAMSNRRALLIIDEAQNLGAAAIEELRMLSNFQFGNHALLQSFLVGQPELRRVLRMPQMEQLRQRIIASYHLGPLRSEETRAYVEHRLRRVGWAGRPGFSTDALEGIHRACGGVPRRINMLCNRLLLAAYLDSAEHIDAARVARVHAELCAEIDGGVPVAASGPSSEPLLCLASSGWSLLAIGALLGAFAAREDLPPAALLQFVGRDAIASREQAQHDLHDLGVDPVAHTVELLAPTSAGRIAEAVAALTARCEAQLPAALLVGGDDSIETACALVAAQFGVPVIRVEAGLRNGERGDPREAARALLDRASSALFAAETQAMDQLRAEGTPDDAALLVGSLAADVVRLGAASVIRAELTLKREALPTSLLTDPAGFVLIWLEEPHDPRARSPVLALDRELRRLGWRVSLLWAAREVDCAGPPPLRADIEQCGLRLVCIQRHAELLGLLRHARCLITDCGWLQDTATALGLACLTLGTRSERRASLHRGSNRLAGLDPVRIAREVAELIGFGGRTSGLPLLWDGYAAERVAARMSDWLLARKDEAYRQHLAAAPVQGASAAVAGADVRSK